MMRALAVIVLALPAVAQAGPSDLLDLGPAPMQAVPKELDCETVGPCTGDRLVCSRDEALQVETRAQADGSYLFQLVEGPSSPARAEAIGATARITTEAVYGTYWTLTTAAGGEAALTGTAVERSGGLRTFTYRALCEAAPARPTQGVD